MRYFLVALLVLLSPFHGALALPGSLPSKECVVTAGANDGYPACANPIVDTNTFVGARADAGSPPPGLAAVPVDVWGTCRYVDNISLHDSLFVPFRSNVEWSSFIANAPPGTINLVTCACPMNVVVQPDSNCSSPSPAQQTIDLPYARTGDTRSDMVTFQCANGSSETATATSNALNCDVNRNASWGTQISYSAPILTCGGLPVTFDGKSITGNTAVNISGDNQVISIPAGNLTLNYSGNNSTICLSGGNDLINVTGNNNNIAVLAGCEVLDVMGAGNTYPPINNAYISENGVQLTPPDNTCMGQPYGTPSQVYP